MLEPVLAVGMTPEAAQRKLRAEPTGNGVTGFVAATGKSYLCEDTSEDPLYLEGARRCPQFAHRARHASRPRDRHAERGKSGAARVQRKRPAVPRDFCPRRGDRPQHAGAVGRRKGQHGRGQRRRNPQRRGHAGRRHSQRRRERDGALHRPSAGRRRTAAIDPAQRPRYQAGHPEGGAVDGADRGAAARPPASNCGRRWSAAACLVVDADESVRSAAHALVGALSLHRGNRPRRQRGPIHGPQPVVRPALRCHHFRYPPARYVGLRPACSSSRK